LNMKTVNLVSIILVIVGALNWGLVGLIDLDIVAAILGQMTVATRLVYILVGIAGLYEAAKALKLLK